MNLLKISRFNAICKRFGNKTTSQKLERINRIDEQKSVNTSQDFSDENYNDSSYDKAGLPPSTFFPTPPPHFDLNLLLNVFTALPKINKSKLKNENEKTIMSNKLNAIFPEATNIFSETTNVDDERK